MRLEPLENRVVIEQIEEDSATPGGIIIPDAAKEKPLKGKILAVGPGKSIDGSDRQPMSVEVGDIVVYAKYSTFEIRVNNQTHIILSEDNILAKLKDETDTKSIEER